MAANRGAERTTTVRPGRPKQAMRRVLRLLIGEIDAAAMAFWRDWEYYHALIWRIDIIQLQEAGTWDIGFVVSRERVAKAVCQTF